MFSVTWLEFSAVAELLTAGPGLLNIEGGFLMQQSFCVSRQFSGGKKIGVTDFFVRGELAIRSKDY